MNLVSEKWIPVLNTAGQRQLISLREAFCLGAQWRDLAVRPHERVALMRLLLCIAHAALNGPSREDWPRVPELLPDAATAYLEKWQDNFDLFHPKKPFLQIAGLKVATTRAKKSEDDEGPLVNASKLDFALATGNQSTLFDHEGGDTNRKISHDKIALDLLTFQNFSPGGRIGAVIWKNYVTLRSSSDAPCAVGSMAHTFWRGENLLQTLHLNMCNQSDIEGHLACISETGLGKPVWEQMPQSMDDTDAWHNATQTYLGRLTPLSRLVLLQRNASTIVLGTGKTFPNFNSEKAPFVEEPTSTIISRVKDKKQANAILAVSPRKALWRELHALVAHRNKGNLGGFWAASVAQKAGNACLDIVVAGMDRDQAEVIDTLESVYHIPQAMQNTPGQRIYEQGIRSAEIILSKLSNAVDAYRAAIGCDVKVKIFIETAATVYWTAAEQNLPLLFACVESLGSDGLEDAQKAWAKALFAAARKAYAAACAPQTPRQHRAYALGLAKLSKPVDDTNSPNTPSETSSDTSHEEDDE